MTGLELQFVRVDRSISGAPAWQMRDPLTNEVLGTVCWYALLDSFGFSSVPGEDVRFGPEALGDIRRFIADANHRYTPSQEARE